jgi:hypothetical protein
MVRQIHPSGVQGCVSGRNLPVNVDGHLVFDVEKGALAIAGGGFSVRN